MFFGNVTDFTNRRNVAIHRIDRLKGNQFCGCRIALAQKLVEVIDIVVAENFAGLAAVADARDHGIVIQLVGKDYTVGELAGER